MTLAYNQLRLNRLIIRTEDALSLAEMMVYAMPPSPEALDRLEVLEKRAEKLAQLKARDVT